MSRGGSWILSAALAVVALASAQAYAQSSLPTSRVLQGTLITPTSANSYYGTSTTHTQGIPATPRPVAIRELARSLGAGRRQPNDYADVVYEYVYNNIDVEFRYGLSKGALGALLDQSGTPFDQVQLLVELLREGAVPATYEAGVVAITPAQFLAWTGISDAQAACRFLADGGIPALVNGSASATCAYSGSVSSIEFAHIWAVANGKRYDPSLKTYQFSTGLNLPSLAQCGTTGCGASTRAALLSGATAQFDSAAGANFVQAANVTQMATTLKGFATNLQTYLQAANPVPTLEDVLGGWQIQPGSRPTPGATLPYVRTDVQKTWADNIPDPYRTTLRVRFDNINYLLYADEIFGDRLMLAGAISGTTRSTELHLSDLWDSGAPEPANRNFSVQALASSVLTGASASNDDLTLEVNHPYAAAGAAGTAGSLMDETVVQRTNLWEQVSQTVSFAPTLIVQTWGATGRGSIQRQARFNDPATPHGNSFDEWTCKILTTVTCRYLTDESLANVAAAWAGQYTRALTLTDWIGKTRSQQHHTVGSIVRWLNGSSIDLRTTVSTTSRSMDAAGRRATAQMAMSLANAFEGGVVEQMYDSWGGAGAIASFGLANEKNQRFYEVNSTNVNTVLSRTSGYSSDDQTFVRSYFQSTAPTYTGVLPDSGQLGTWTIAGQSAGWLFSPFAAFSGDDTSIAYVTTAQNKGATGPTDPYAEASRSVQTSVSAKTVRDMQNVDLASGTAALDPEPDLVTGSGSFPSSLPFKRSYVSSARIAGTFIWGGEFGYWDQGNDLLQTIGWTHNYQIEASLSNEAFQALGEDSALDASSAIAALITLYDLSYSTPTFQSRLTSIFAANWLTDQLLGNAVSVQEGHSQAQFLRLPDGTFNPPPGSADRVVVTGARQRAVKVGAVGFNYNGLQFDLRRRDGSLLRFSPGAYDTAATFGPWVRNQFNPDTWTFPDGLTVTFTYERFNLAPGMSRVRLKKVENSLGRALNFDHTVNNGPVDYTYLRVYDENSRSVRYGSGTIDGIAANMVTYPDGTKTYYSYANDPGDGHARLRVYLPTSATSPRLTFHFDRLNRVSRLDYGSTLDREFFAARIADERMGRGEIRDALGALTTLYFNERGNLLSEADPLGRVTWRTYDTQHRLKRVTEPEGNAVEYTYDVRSNILTKKDLPKTGSTISAATTTYTYMEGPTVASCSNPASCNNPASVTDTKSRVSNYAYNTLGQLTQSRGPTVGSARAETDYCYTALNGVSLLTGKIQVAGGGKPDRVTKYAYNASNKYVLDTARVDPADSLTTTCAATTKSAPLSLVTTFTFDGVGNVRTIDGPRTDVSDVMTYTFDDLRRLKQVDGPSGTNVKTVYGYYDDGALKTTDRQEIVSGSPVMRRELREYLATGDLFKVTDPESNVTRYDYDAVGRLALVTDPDGRRTGTVFDLAGQVLCTWKGWNSTTAPTTCTWNPSSYVAAGNAGPLRYAEYAYTPSGKTSTVTDANNSVTQYVYDGLNRLRYTLFPNASDGTRCVAPTSEGATPAPTCTASGGTTPTYEELWYTTDGSPTGTLCSADMQPCRKRTRRAETIAYAYDNMDRVSTRTPTGLPAVTFTYDLLSEPLGVTSPANSGGTIPAHSTVYDYDSAGRKAFEENTLNGVARRVSYGYDEAGNRTRTTWPDGYFVTYQYDVLSQLQYARENSTSANELAYYQYDELLRRKSARFAGQSGNRATYTYETDGDIDLLSNVLGSITVSLDYGHSAAGRITSIQASDSFYLPKPATATVAYVPDKLNRYTSIGGNATTYDANGNLTTWGPSAAGQAYTYDSENRLRTSVVAGGANTTYDYDGLGRRISKMTTGQPATATYYLLDGDEEVAELNTSGAVLRRYITSNTIDDRIARAEGSATTLPTKYYYHTNHQGSTLAVANADGSINQQLAYDEYGNLTSQPPAATTGETFRFTGRRFDQETGLYYYRARYYSPQMGRFLQSDPVGYQDDFNLYAYVYNDPLNRADPAGTNGCSLKNCGVGQASLPQGFVNFSAGLGDVALSLVSLGILDGEEIRTVLMDDAGSVDTDSGAYKGGFVTGVLASVGLGRLTAGASAAPKAGTRGASGELTTASGRTWHGNSTGSSASGGDARAPMHPKTQQALDAVKKPSRSHGECCEIDAVNKALNAGDRVEGATMGPVRSNETGRVLPPCSTCREVKKTLGVE